jgi:hypothetical protein
MRIRPALAIVVLALAAAAAAPTPTPRPRLTGGFGRPRATPSPAGPGSGQSMADVVRAAQESRGQTRGGEKPGVTINNKTLVTNPEKGRVSTSKVAPVKPTAPVAPARASAPAERGPESAAAPGTPDSAGTEEQWRAAAHRARARVEEAAARIAELEAVVRKLENDFYAWDDGQYRDRVIKPSWDRSREQLEEARRDLAAAQKDVADLPEKARRAGALPGWIRE